MKVTKRAQLYLMRKYKRGILLFLLLFVKLLLFYSYYMMGDMNQHNH